MHIFRLSFGLGGAKGRPMKRASFKIRFVKTLWRIFLILIGSVLSGVAISMVLRQHHLISGGVSGTSMLLSYITPINTGVWIIALNIPLFAIAWKKIDLNFCVYSIIGTVSLSFFVFLFGRFEPVTISNPLLAAIFGGILCGAGTGTVLRARASQGGTDIISVIVRQKLAISIGTVTLYVNLVLVVLLSLLFKSIELGLLTIFSQFITSKAIDRTVTGLNTAKAVTIISDRSEEIAEYIMRRMYRGVTFLEGEGGFGHRHKKVIWCIVTTSQLTRLKGAMKMIDPNAFMAIADSAEVVGEGFYQAPF